MDMRKFETPEALRYWAEAEDDIDSSCCMMATIDSLSDLVLLGDMPAHLMEIASNLAVELDKLARSNGDFELAELCGRDDDDNTN